MTFVCLEFRVFSNRAICINEVIKFKIIETKAGWRGTFQIGVIYDNPETFYQAAATKYVTLIDIYIIFALN